MLEIKLIQIAGRKYLIGTDGTVMKKSGKQLTKYIRTTGYEYVCIKDGELRKKHQVHRLVALAFLPNPKNLPQVNHIDGNKRNNRVENLEWVTISQNQMHNRYILGNETGFLDTPIICIETGKRYRSTRDAWRDTGISYSHISECANGKRKSAGGFHWKHGGEQRSSI